MKTATHKEETIVEKSGDLAEGLPTKDGQPNNGESETSLNSVLAQISQAKAAREAQLARTSQRIDKVHDLANFENELFEVRRRLTETGLTSHADEKIQAFVEDREATIDELRIDPLVQEDFGLHDEERDEFIVNEQHKAGRAISDGIHSRHDVLSTMTREIMEQHPAKQVNALKEKARQLGQMVKAANRIGRFRMHEAMPWAQEKTGQSYKLALQENYNPQLDLADRLLKAVAREFYQDRQKSISTKKRHNQ